MAQGGPTRLHLVAARPFEHLTVCGRLAAAVRVASIAALSSTVDRCESCWRMRSGRRRAIQVARRAP